MYFIFNSKFLATTANSELVTFSYYYQVIVSGEFYFYSISIFGYATESLIWNILYETHVNIQVSTRVRKCACTHEPGEARQTAERGGEGARKREFALFANTWNRVASQRRGRECATTAQGTLEFSILCRGIALINETIWLPETLFGAACGGAACAPWKRGGSTPSEYPWDRFTYRTRSFAKYGRSDATIKGERQNVSSGLPWHKSTSKFSVFSFRD